MKNSGEYAACKYCGKRVTDSRAKACPTCAAKAAAVRTLLSLRYTGAKRKSVRLCSETTCVWRDAQGFCPGKGCLKQLTGV